MRRSHLVLLTMAMTAGLGLALFLALTGRSSSILAASRSDHDAFGDLLKGINSPLYQNGGFSCTLTITTTDSLEEAGNPNDDPDHAAPLSDYNGLALVTGYPGEQVPADEDWFKLNNAKVGSIYGVEALPDETINYNLGIVVYDWNLTAIITDANTVDNNRAEITLEAENQGPYYFKVYQLAPGCQGDTYYLETSFTQPTPTPSKTPPPSADKDEYESNDSFGEAKELPVQMLITLDNLTFHVSDDEDWFKFWTKSGKWYWATTSDLSGVDTEIEIRDRDNSIEKSDDDGGGGYASQAEWEAGYDDYYYIRVIDKGETIGSYNLKVEEISAPATSTPGPTATPGPGVTPDPDADNCEDNLDFEHACVIPVNVSQTFNFVPAYGEGPDNDFYKIWVKRGLHFRCATSDLDPGIDPNMIVFSGPSWGDAIGGNDDIGPGNYNCAFNYYATYEGWLYVLVGTGDRTPSDVYDSRYTLTCEKRVSVTSTPEPTDTPRPTATPEAPTATPTTTGSPVATPTPSRGLSVRLRATPSPAPPVTTPSSRFIPINLLIYYDADKDHRPSSGEGISGISAQAYEVATNQLLAQGFTDGQGSLEFTVAPRGSARVAVPFLSFSQLVTGEGADIVIRVPPHSLAGGAP